VRLPDLFRAIPAVCGKLEQVYEGEQEGPAKVGWHILGEAVKALWAERKLPTVVKDDEDERDQGPWKPILRWFAAGNRIELDDRQDDRTHAAALAGVPGLAEVVHKLLKPSPEDAPLWQEFILEGLFHGGALAREDSVRGLVYSDLLAHLMTARKTRAAEE
jgi:magnesium chelatase subunit I